MRSATVTHIDEQAARVEDLLRRLGGIERVGHVHEADYLSGFVLKAGDTMSGALMIALAAADSPALVIPASSDGTSEHAEAQIGDWRFEQDPAASGTKKLTIGNGSDAIEIDTSRRVGLSVAPESGFVLKVGGHVKIVTENAHPPTAPSLTITANAHASNEAAQLLFGGWRLGQDSGSNGTKDLYWWDDAASAVRLLIDTSGRFSLGAATIDTNYRLNVQPVSGQHGILVRASSSTGPIAFKAEESSDGTSNKVEIQIAGWAIGQDIDSNGSRDFFIYDNNASGTVLTIDTSGSLFFRKEPITSHTMTPRRNGSTVTTSSETQWYMLLGKLCVGGYRADLSSTSTSTGTEFDVVGSSHPLPAHQQVCGSGAYYDASATTQYLCVVFIQNSGGSPRFFFTRTDVSTTGFEPIGVSPNMATSLNTDWIDFTYLFLSTANPI